MNTTLITLDALEPDVVRIARHHGTLSQLAIAQEECAELVQAISKYNRVSRKFCLDNQYREAAAQELTGALDHVSEEMADVLLMLRQLMILLDNEETVAHILRKKVHRTLVAMRGEEFYESGHHI